MNLVGSRAEADKRLVYAIRLELRSGERQLPEPMAGAIVVAFSFSDGPEDAARKSFQAALAKGVRPKVLEDGFTIPVHQWRDYVEGQWPEFADQMPSQADIAKRLESGEVIFGPLIGFREG